MSNNVEVVVLVEGPTEQRFIKELLAPYMINRGVFLTAIILDKPGEKGGDVKFARTRNDIEKHLKQRHDTRVTLMIDYYGIKGDWPGYQESKQERLHRKKAERLNTATADAVAKLFPEQRTEHRFIPYVSMFEIEALYFSEPSILAEKLGVKQKLIHDIIASCGEPEKINDNSQTAPSKRLEALSERFKKTSTGLAIARAVGIERMRQACPIFDAWVKQLETLSQ
ncbi:MAG: DUF4276 family protein [Verrucomicrobiota bacterium]|nr:DUF4276 family protein [Verrucomicrobiota bacterium]